MSTINQLVSEIAHSIKQADSVPVRRAIKLGIIHARNEIIRKSYSNHNYTDKVLQQRFKVQLIDIPDGDLYGSENVINDTIKRTLNKVPRPVRLINNLPFHSIRTAGVINPVEIAYIKEASAKYYKSLPGFCSGPSYDYINGYVYVNLPVEGNIHNLGAIIIESVFEYPHIIETETVEGKLDVDTVSDDDEFLIPEDMINAIKQVILSTWNPEVIRDTNETSSQSIIQ